MNSLEEFVKMSKDRKGQVQLYDICYRKIYLTCKRFESIDEDAESLFNNGFCKALANLPKHEFHSKEKTLNWMCRVITNNIIDTRRKRKEYFIPKIALTHNTAVRKLEAEYILNAIDKNLSPIQKNIFHLYSIMGYTHKEIGKILNISDGTSKWYLSEARKKLKIILS